MYFKVFNFIFYMGVAVFGYFNIYFKEIGFSSTQIGTINSIARMASLLILPVWGMAADYYKMNKRLLMIALGGSVIASFLFLTTQNFVAVILIMAIFFIFRDPIVPLADAQLLGYLGEKGNQYGKYRIWGSIGYTVVVSIIGYFLEQTTSSNIFYLNVFILLLSLFIVGKLPQSNAKIKLNNFKQFKALLKKERLFAFVIFAFFINLTFNLYNIYFPIYFSDHGGGKFLYGVSLTIAASSEMAIFHFSEHIMEKIKIKYIFLVSALAFSLRWFILASVDSPMIMLSSQVLHSLTFGLFHVTSVNFINLISGEEFRATGQNIYATTIGVSVIAAGFIGGPIYDNVGGSSLYIYSSITALVVGLIYFAFLNHYSEVSYSGD